ncbi:MAG: tetratricopeptide repeat protein [Paludibacteraceae bacterium]|nr:tetratricopeptide repeat protein [Paludibacteraceae bacterium]
MKKTLLFAALMLVSIGCMAQKLNVRQAKNLALAEKPDFAAARAAIKEALANDETKDQAETWYIAGLIGYQQNEAEYLKLQMGKGGTDYNVRGAAVLESYNYWLQADKLAMTPVYDKKGKAKYDTRTRRQIAEKMLTYFRQYELVYYAQNLWEKQDYAKSYEAFKAYASIPNLDMMQERRYQEQMPRDTTYKDICYNAAMVGFYAELYADALHDFMSLMDEDYKATICAQYVYQSYLNLGDTVSANQWLDECIQRFPNDSWFVQNRINNLVNANLIDEALIYIDQAMKQDPQVQYLLLKGSILEVQHRYDEAVAVYEQALQMDAENAELWYNYGIVYVDMANELGEKAAYMNANDYKLARVEITELFRKALPYYQKAYQLNPENDTYKHQLRSLYYRLGMEKEYNELAQ